MDSDRPPADAQPGTEATATVTNKPPAAGLSEPSGAAGAPNNDSISGSGDPSAVPDGRERGIVSIASHQEAVEMLAGDVKRLVTVDAVENLSLLYSAKISQTLSSVLNMLMLSVKLRKKNCFLEQKLTHD